MHQDHPNLSNEINANLRESELAGGVWVVDHPDYVADEIKAQPVLPVGSKLKIKARGGLYTLEKRGPEEFWIEGDEKRFPAPTRCNIHGSTWGGSMITLGFIGRGMRMEFSIGAKNLLTGTIEEITEVR